MCNLIFTLCPTCSKVAAQSRVKNCADKANPLISRPCTKNEIRNFAKAPSVSCTSHPQGLSNSVGSLTRDILEQMSFKIPELCPAQPPKDVILPRWTFETLTAIQTKELFFEHITRHHSVDVKNRQFLSSQRGGIPLCLMAGVVRSRKPVRVFQRRSPRFAPPTTSRPQGRGHNTIDLPPSAWNNRRRISRLGIAPAPRAQSLQADQPPARTPTCLILSGIKQRSEPLYQGCIVAPLAPRISLELKIPEKASTSTEPQATEPTPSSAISAHSESHIPEPSPQEQRFSAVAFAQIPSHFDLRHAPTPSPLRIPTEKQRAEERERRETLDQIQERVRQRQDRERQDRERQDQGCQQLETERIQDFQQRGQEQRSRSEVASPRTANDVQFQRVRPLKSKGSL
ncbi:hypothetical protein EYC80_007944 [Monilinia laxa]|uniref:Uncharacterized protein n=1 Tax=Monilinia laxa TaxID=61186 RepID=A0A5N6JSZ9_MONLA|nr:hypothetical protein EYC80_007944 [Monilinia laxa]